MSDVHEICRHHLLAAAQAAGPNAGPDVVGRAMLGQVIALWRQARSLDDIRSELESTAENLDPDQEHVFMRP